MKTHGNTTHGLTNTKEYRTWENMKRRCHNPGNAKYAVYGGRGIVVCERWRSSFENFFADMGKAPGPEYSIERVDNDGPYSPDNCKWIPMQDQMKNQQKTRKYTFQGETLNISEWAKHLGMDRSCLQTRFDNGWSVEQALTTPSSSHNRRSAIKLTFQGRTQNLAQWAKELGINISMLTKRIKRGVPVEVALTKPPRKGKFIHQPW